jgi:hypothetical protein
VARTIKPSDGLTVKILSERIAAKFGVKPVKLAQLLQKWIPAGIVKPKGSVLRGQGNYREFEPEELDKAALLFECHRHGYPLHRLHTIRSGIDSKLKDPSYAVALDEARQGKPWVMCIGLLKNGNPTILLSKAEPSDLHSWNTPKITGPASLIAHLRSLLIVRVDTILHDL